MDDDKKMRIAAAFAKEVALHCVRNTGLENLHAGSFPETVTGDYSDVKVVDGHGREIPWTMLSRIDDVEMKAFIQEVVNKIYTYALYQDDAGLREYLDLFIGDLKKWDTPQLDKSMMSGVGQAGAFKIDSK